jgi:anti-sigma factor RsiW
MMHDAHPDSALLARWLDGELGAAAAADVTAHVADCSHCQSEQAQWQVLGEALAPAARTLPPGFVTRTCARAVDAPPLRAPLWWLDISPAWRVGLAALLLVSAVTGWQLGGTLVPARGPVADVVAALAAPELAVFETVSPDQPGRRP